MSRQDKLPVLTRPAKRTNPDTLATAIDALRSALEVEVARAEPASDAPTWEPDSFTPIGQPKPIWRAGAKASSRGSGRAGVAESAVARDGPDTDKDPLTRRFTAIHLPHFAMERWQRWAARQNDAPPEDIPAALAVEGTHGPVIHAVNRAATEQGVHTTARVVDMRALVPELHITFADIAGDRVALNKLMLWARLSSLGLSANLACAPTHGAAWALARFGEVRSICPPETLAVQTAPLPARALRLDDGTLLLLNRLGLKTIGDLAAVPRISLARRFSRAGLAQNPLLRLDQLMGKLAEPITSPDDPPRFAVQSKLAEPVQDPTPHLPALCHELCMGLQKAGYGARRVTVTVYRTDGEVRHITVATAQANRDPAHLLRLFDDKLDAIDPGFGFDLITLDASVAEELQTHQTRLDGQVDDGAELARLVDRLTARLGAPAIRKPTSVQSHIPERAEDWSPAVSAPAGRIVTQTARPIRMFDHPEEIRVVYAVPEGPPAQFVWRRLTHRVTRFAGPERVAVLGDGRGETPRWFVHGVFA